MILSMIDAQDRRDNMYVYGSGPDWSDGEHEELSASVEDGKLSDMSERSVWLIKLYIDDSGNELINRLLRGEPRQNREHIYPAVISKNNLSHSSPTLLKPTIYFCK
jgi:hypothetical protein